MERGDACRLAAVGVALMLLDLRIERFDLLNDVVGVALVLAAIHRLIAATSPVDRAPRLRLLWWGLLGVTAVEEVLAWFGSGEPTGPSFTATGSLPETLLSITGSLLALFALLALARGFGRLAPGDASLTRSWETTHKLLLGLYAPLTGLVVLLGLLDLAVRLDGRSTGGLDVQLEGGAALALLPFFLAYLIPPAHLAVSLWRTSRSTRRRVPDRPAT